MEEADPVKIAKLQVEMENVKELLKSLVSKFDKFNESFQVGSDQWATKDELKALESKFPRFIWVTNIITGIVVSVITALIVAYVAK